MQQIKQITTIKTPAATGNSGNKTMKTLANIIETKAFAKGETYTATVEDYNEALAFANEVSNAIESQFKAENPYISLHTMPFTKVGNRYCIKVWMQYSDMTAGKDIRVNIYFGKNWFAAGRKAAAERQERRKEENAFFSLFGF